jgi:hypothetical protein
MRLFCCEAIRDGKQPRAEFLHSALNSTHPEHQEDRELLLEGLNQP